MKKIISIGITLLACSAALQVNAQDQTLLEMVEQGRQVFENNCVPCHGTGPGDDGAPMLPGTHALHLKYRGDLPALLTERTDLSVEFIQGVVRNGIASMPPFRKSEITDQDIQAIMAYIIAE
jgi:mono/diheme cytochrome c family protein